MSCPACGYIVRVTQQKLPICACPPPTVLVPPLPPLFYTYRPQVVADLNQEITRVATAHARLVRAAESKLRDFGIPTEELGFLPIVASTARGGGGNAGRGRRGGGAEGGQRGDGGKDAAEDRERILDVSVNRPRIRA